MTRISCLAGLEHDEAVTMAAVLKKAGVHEAPVELHLNVVELGQLKPRLLVCDLDGAPVDPLELLRQLRFVLPKCIILVYTGVFVPAWSVACHLAGANGLLAKGSLRIQLANGVREAMLYGCYTDPRFTDTIETPLTVGRKVETAI